MRLASSCSRDISEIPILDNVKNFEISVTSYSKVSPSGVDGVEQIGRSDLRQAFGCDTFTTKHATLSYCIFFLVTVLKLLVCSGRVLRKEFCIYQSQSLHLSLI